MPEQLESGDAHTGPIVTDLGEEQLNSRRSPSPSAQHRRHRCGPWAVAGARASCPDRGRPGSPGAPTWRAPGTANLARTLEPAAVGRCRGRGLWLGPRFAVPERHRSRRGIGAAYNPGDRPTWRIKAAHLSCKQVVRGSSPPSALDERTSGQQLPLSATDNGDSESSPCGVTGGIPGIPDAGGAFIVAVRPGGPV